MEDTSIKMVKQYYDDTAEKEWDRLDSHPFEFVLTTWMMDKYIKSGDTILDIGGGPGRYSIYYAQNGCSVTLVDLSDSNISLAEQKAKQFGVSIKSYAKNCLELDELNLEQFDHVFLMGPLYHLQKENDRINAVKAALRHLKKDGKLYVSFIMAFAGIIYDLQHAGYIVGDANNPATAPLLESVAHGNDYLGPGFTAVYFYNQNNILSFMQRFTIEKLHLFGQESFLAPNKLDIIAREHSEINCWIELAKRYIELPELLSWSEHAMYIGNKL
ncbi:MAG TPA: class I SAM-dependent methyltransferase [Clostridiales bacterium]|nr:class I SAM-dependent methyltransferase [Clostridiales bacterium]